MLITFNISQKLRQTLQRQGRGNHANRRKKEIPLVLLIHAVAEEGIPLRDIAQAISVGLGVPLVSLSSETANDHFGWLLMFAQMDMLASGTQTRQRVGWHPSYPGLLTDIARYFSL